MIRFRCPLGFVVRKLDLTMTAESMGYEGVQDAGCPGKVPDEQTRGEPHGCRAQQVQQDRCSFFIILNHRILLWKVLGRDLEVVGEMWPSSLIHAHTLPSFARDFRLHLRLTLHNESCYSVYCCRRLTR